MKKIFLLAVFMVMMSSFAFADTSQDIFAKTVLKYTPLLIDQEEVTEATVPYGYTSGQNPATVDNNCLISSLTCLKIQGENAQNQWVDFSSVVDAIPTVLTANNDWAMNFYLRFNETATGSSKLVFQNLGGSGVRGIVINLPTDYSSFLGTFNLDGSSCTIDYVFPDDPRGKWQMWTFNYLSATNELKFYQNGTNVADATCSPDIARTSSYFRIGQSGFQRTATMKMQSLEMYYNSLTPTEISFLYDVGFLGTEPTQTANIKFDKPNKKNSTILKFRGDVKEGTFKETGKMKIEGKVNKTLGVQSAVVTVYEGYDLAGGVVFTREYIPTENISKYKFEDKWADVFGSYGGFPAPSKKLDQLIPFSIEVCFNGYCKYVNFIVNVEDPKDTAVYDTLNEAGNGLGVFLDATKRPLGNFIFYIAIIGGIVALVLGVGAVLRSKLGNM